jgi:hypothetical protein
VSCRNESKSKGFCNKHYQKWKKYGDPLFSAKVHVNFCHVVDCKEKHVAKGFCKSHYKRWTRYGDPLFIPDPVETKRKQSTSKLGNTPWNKDKTDVFSEESLTKMSQSHKKNPSPSLFKKGKDNIMFGKKGPKNPFYGKKHTEKSNEKNRQKHLGKKASDETRKKQSEKKKDVPLTQSHRDNISKSKKGPKNPMYGKKGKDSPFFGHHHTEEVKRQKSIQSKEFANRPEVKEAQREVLRRSRKNQQKPNKPELKIKNILTDSGLIFNPEQDLNKFIQSSNQSNFGMFINIPFSHPKLQQKFKETDFLIPPNKIIEHNGTFDHADPRIHSPDKKIHDRTAEEIWKKEKMILDSLSKEGYKILVIWEQDLLKDEVNTAEKILKFAKS